MPHRSIATTGTARDSIVDSALLIDVGALTIAIATGAQGPARWLLALAFVTFVPGWAVCSWFRIVDWPGRAGLAAGVSLATCTVTATIMLWIQAWSPIALFTVLAASSSVSIGLHLVRAFRLDVGKRGDPG